MTGVGLWTQLSGLDVIEDIICRSGVELSKTGDSFSGSVSNFHEKQHSQIPDFEANWEFCLVP